MIKFAENKMVDFVNFLNWTYPTEKDAYLTILHGHDCVEVGGEVAWAAYRVCGKSVPVIFIAGEVSSGVAIAAGKGKGDDPNEILFEDLAHEYAHHIQYCRGDAEYNEEEATRFAKEAMSIWPNFEPLDKKELFDECERQRGRIIKLQKQNIELLKLILQSETKCKAGGD
ncbi:MAG: hypothetical protein AB7C96_12805 [Hydrogenovibrio sp.]